MRCFIGIDLGSTTTKAVVIDENQNILGTVALHRGLPYGRYLELRQRTLHAQRAARRFRSHDQRRDATSQRSQRCLLPRGQQPHSDQGDQQFGLVCDAQGFRWHRRLAVELR